MPDLHQQKDTDGGDALTTPLTCEAVLSPPLQHIGGGDQPTTQQQQPQQQHRLSYYNQQPAWHCSFSPDGAYLAVAYGAPEACVRLWKCNRQQQPSPATATTADIANNNNQQQRQQQCSPSWQLVTTLSGIQTRTIRCVAFAPLPPPALTLASASFDGTVAVWTQQRKQNNKNNVDGDDDWDCLAQLEGHDNEVKGVAWNATASLLATSGRDKTVWIWECFLPGTVGSADDDGDFECAAVLHGHEADVKCVRFAPSRGRWGDGDDVALSASYDSTVRVWAEEAGDWFCAAAVVAEGGAHAATVWTLAVAPSGTRLVSGSADGSLAIYKCYSAEEWRKQQLQQQQQQQQQQEVSATEEKQQSSSSNKSVWKCVGKLARAHADSTVYSVDYAPARVGHGRIASGGADNRLQIYREAMGSTSDQPSFLLDAAATVPGGDINCVRWHPWDGSVLASAGDDGSVRIWRYKV